MPVTKATKASKFYQPTIAQRKEMATRILKLLKKDGLSDPDAYVNFRSLSVDFNVAHKGGFTQFQITVD